MEDEEIISLYWERDEDAIAETDLKYGPYCRNISYAILRDQEDSRECVSDTWLHTWYAIPPSQRAEKLRAHLEQEGIGR